MNQTDKEVSSQFLLLLIKSLKIINGAALLSIITFVGTIWSAQGNDSVHILYGVEAFLIGLLLAVGATFLAWWQYSFEENSFLRNGLSGFVCSLCLFSTAAFMYGAAVTSCAVKLSIDAMVTC